METHDRVALWVICILLLSTLTFGIGYFVLWDKYSKQTKDLNFCTDTYNQLSLQYYHNCTSTNIYPNYTAGCASDFKPIPASLDSKQYIQSCKTEMRITYHHTYLEGGMEYYQACYRCSDLNQSIMPGLIAKGDWMCPVDENYASPYVNTNY